LIGLTDRDYPVLTNVGDINMALNAFVESLDNVDEPFKNLYKETDGGYLLDITGTEGFSLENTAALKDALSKERGIRDKFEKQAKELKSQLTMATQSVEEVAQKAADKQAAELSTQLDAFKKSLQEKEAQIDKLTRHTAVVNALVKAGGSVGLLTPHVLANTRTVSKDDGTYAVEVVDAEGNTRFNSQGNALSVEELVSEMRSTEEYGLAFAPTNNSGSGSTSKGNVGNITKQVSREKFESMSPADKMGFVKSGGKVI